MSSSIFVPPPDPIDYSSPIPTSSSSNAGNNGRMLLGRTVVISLSSPFKKSLFVAKVYATLGSLHDCPYNLVSSVTTNQSSP